MKFVNTNRTDNGEGKPLCTYTCLFYLNIGLSHNKRHSKVELLSLARLI